MEASTEALGPTFDLAGLMNLFHDRIPMRIVRQRPSGAKDAIAPFPGRLHEVHLDLDLLAFGHAEVFVEFDGLAVDLAV